MLKRIRYNTDRLFTKSSFLIGMGSVLNIKGEYFPFNSDEGGTEADMKALRNDWRMVGQDLYDILQQNDINDPHRTHPTT